jgi:RNA polymerase sigma-70 factor, ECF subfamily
VSRTPQQTPSPDDGRDAELVRRIRGATGGGGGGGLADRQAWGELVRRHQDRVFAVCFRMLNDREAAADLTQDTFVKVIQGLESFDERARLSTWLTRIAMNACLSHLRAQKLRRHASLDAVLPPSLTRGAGVRSADGSGSGVGMGAGLASGREQSPAQGVESGDRRRLVAAALATLEPDQRAILVLRDVQGLEYDQIAAALEIAGGTVKSRLFRARAALREAMERMEGKG